MKIAKLEEWTKPSKVDQSTKTKPEAGRQPSVGASTILIANLITNGIIAQPKSNISSANITNRGPATSTPSPYPDRGGAQNFQNLDYNWFLNASQRKIRKMPGDSCNRCGFNSMACQIRGSGKKINAEEIRRALGYGPNEMFCTTDTNRTQGINGAANLLQQPVIAINYNGNRIVNTYSLAIPNTNQVVYLNVRANLRGAFANEIANSLNASENDGNYANYEHFIQQMKKWVKVEGEQTLLEGLIALQKNPNTVVLVNGMERKDVTERKTGRIITIETNCHFDAAVHV